MVPERECGDCGRTGSHDAASVPRAGGGPRAKWGRARQIRIIAGVSGDVGMDISRALAWAAGAVARSVGVVFVVEILPEPGLDFAQLLRLQCVGLYSGGSPPAGTECTPGDVAGHNAGRRILSALEYGVCPRSAGRGHCRPGTSCLDSRPNRGGLLAGGNDSLDGADFAVHLGFGDDHDRSPRVRENGGRWISAGLLSL